MKNTNKAIVDNFFSAYSKRDMEGIRKVMDEA
jgi:hypothetical protein